MLLLSLLSRLARLSAYKVFLQAPVAFRFFNPCSPFFSGHRLFCSQQHIIYIEATHISTLPAHFFTRNRGGLPGSGATFDASLPSFHAATHFFCRLYRSFYTRPWLLHQRISRIFAFLSRGEAFFIVSATTFSHEAKPFLSWSKSPQSAPVRLEALFFSLFSQLFLPHFGIFFLRFCHFHMSNFAIFGFIFVFARKKFVVCLVAKVFCSTFALAFQRCGVWLSLKKAIFERIP